MEECKAVLSNPKSSGSSIESYLVQYALIVLCAEIEEKVTDIVKNRAFLTCDESLANFVSTISRRVLRSVKKNELAGFVGYFGKKEQGKFNDFFMDDTGQKRVQSYDNAINARHSIAHGGSGVQVTFSELESAISVAQHILQAFEQSIYPNSDAEANNGANAS
jgi:hypothetical protein